MIKILWTLLGLAAVLLAAMFFWLLFISLAALFVSPKKDYTKDSKLYRFILQFSTLIALRFLRVRTHTQGTERIPDVPFLLVSNHCSNFDPLIQWTILRKSKMAFISKPENFKIYAFGRIIRRCCFLPIDRQDPRAALKTLIKAADLLKAGEVSVGIYPEGTRSTNGQLLPFHDGVFKIAQMANVPILVMASVGPDEVRKNWTHKHTDVYMSIVRVMPTDFVKSHTTHELSALVRQELLEETERLKALKASCPSPKQNRITA